MIPFLIEAATRSLALGLVVGLALRLARVRNPYLEKSAWTAVVIAALLMPLAMCLHAPVLRAPLSMAAGVLSVEPTPATRAVGGVAWWMLGALYCLTGIGLLARFAANLVRMTRIRRRASIVRESWTGARDVRTTDELATPATFGSTILLPRNCAEWSECKRAAVMSHEGSHVDGRDCYRLWLASLYRCIFWLSPLGWWLERRLMALAETTSDAAAQRTVRDGAAYAQVLLEFLLESAAHAGASRHVALAMARSSIAARIERVLAPGVPAAVPPMSRRVLTLAGLLPAALVLAALQLAPLHAARARSSAQAPVRHDTRAGEASRPVPRITGWPSNLMEFYPPDARRKGIAGSVEIAVTLDAEGRATNTEILREDPADEGFGAAASTAAHAFKYSNPTGRPARLVYLIKFALSKGKRRASGPRRGVGTDP